MFKKQLTIDKYMFSVTICILINLLESWYFGLNWEAVSITESMCDFVTAIPIVVASLWFIFTNNIMNVFKGYVGMLIIVWGYVLIYRIVFM